MLTPQRLERLIQSGLIIIIGLMPFHAFITTWLGTTLGHRSLIQSWKELLLVILAGLTGWLLLHDATARQGLSLRQPVILAGLSFMSLGLLISLIAQPGATATVFGAKTDYEGLAAGGIALAVATPVFIRRLIAVTLASGAGVIAFGLLQAYVWPPDFLTVFGYGPDTIQPFLTLNDQSTALRFPATLGGPNQLGAYLIIILSLAMGLAWNWTRQRLWLPVAIMLGGGVVLINTFSRSAWIGTLAALTIVTLLSLPGKWRRPAFYSGAVAALIMLIAIPWFATQSPAFRHYVFRDSVNTQTNRSSDGDHAQSLERGVDSLFQAPFGHGLGSAGPAALQTGHGPVIENHYLQIGYELGWGGLIAWLAVLFFTAHRLYQTAPASPAARALLGSLCGIAAAALFLPVWGDSTLMLVFWILTGTILSQTVKEVRHV